MIDKESFVFHWAQGRGLLTKYKEMNAMQILAHTGNRVVRDGQGWRIEEIERR